MIKSIKISFIRNWSFPITYILLLLVFNVHEFSGPKEVISTFCVMFTINWIFDKTIMQWSINQGKKFDKKKAN